MKGVCGVRATTGVVVWRVYGKVPACVILVGNVLYDIFDWVLRNKTKRMTGDLYEWEMGGDCCLSVICRLYTRLNSLENNT